MAVENINIDFEVLKTGNPDKLIICDTSTWAHIENKPAIIEITLPTGKMITHQWGKKENNVFNTSNLYLSPTNTFKHLPDGVYKITLKGSPNTFNKTKDYIRTEKLQLEIDTLYILEGDNYQSISESVKHICKSADYMLNASESAMRLGEKKKAYQYYNEAKNIVEEFNKCKECQHNLY
jgi:hypothetical protein